MKRRRNKQQADDDMRDHYDLSKLREVLPRGHYAARYAAGPVVMPNEPPAHPSFWRALVLRFHRLTHRHGETP